jgi:putative peptidoglycan lipid II flippase
MGRALRNIGMVSGVTMLSRVLGLGRDMAIAAVFGASALASAFVTAFTLPNLFRRLLGEGALTAALVPTLQEETRRGGAEGVWELVNEAGTWVLLATCAICGAAMALLGAHGWWAPALAGAGWEAGLIERWVAAARLGLLLFPYLVLVCLAAVISAALQTRERFLEPALNPVWLNLSMLGLLYGGVRLGGGDAETSMRWLCAGVLVGGVLQLLVPASALLRLGWRPRWAPRAGPGLRQVGRLMLPTLFGTAIYLVNTTLSRLLGLSLDDAAATILNLSTRLMELPIGVFALAVSTVIFPRIARHAAEGRPEELAADYRAGMRLILLVNVPAAAGLAVLAGPITRVLFERGAFTAADTARMTPVLAASALALPFLAFVSLALRAFYARKDTRTPVLAAWWSFVVNLGLGLLLMGWLGAPGLALAATAAVITQALFLQARLAREHGGLRFGLLAVHLAKVVVASGVMAAAALGCHAGWERVVGIEGGRGVAGLALAVGAGAGVYLCAVWMLRVEGRDELTASLRRKLGRT